jgi:HlyD family secretion protein
METRINLDAFRDKQFGGTVRRISSFVLDVEKQARTVDIEATFSREDAFKDLLAGYSADVEIIISTRSDTLKIPTEAIVDSRTVYVYMPGEKIVREVTVKTGLANWAFTEILSGLTENQEVVINVDKPGLQDGAAAVVSEDSQ